MSIVEVTGDTSYPNTGGTVGYPITPATFGFNAFAATSDVSQDVPLTPYFNLGNLAVTGAGGFVKIDDVTNNLRFFGSSGTEIANTVTAVSIGAILMAFGT
jgi:hypothetical protein